jgi:MoxR-like ATPase
MDYAGMNMKELRSLAHDLRRQGDVRFAGLASTDILNMSKADLQCLLEGRDLGDVRSGNGNGHGDLADVIARAIQDKLHIEAPGVDADYVNALLQDKLDDFQAEFSAKMIDAIAEHSKNNRQEITVITPSGERRDVGRQHKCFEDLLALVGCRQNVFLVGPAGSGKTFTAHAVADALGLPFYAISVGLQTTKTDLLGFIDANGVYRPSLGRRAFESGGVWLIDEIDAGNPNVITTLNALTSPGIKVAAFPDGMVEKHPDFVCLAAGNTYGRGSDRMYVGRNALDAASLNRFAMVDFDYDEGLESELGLHELWTVHVQKIRRAAFDLKEKVVVSPRATFAGGKLLQSGARFDFTRLEDMLIW